MILAIVAGLLMLSIAEVSAGSGGTPNNNACFGQAVRSLATTIDFGELMRWEAQNDTVPLAGPGASAETHYYQMCRDSD
jgi:hypothetical protein